MSENLRERVLAIKSEGNDYFKKRNYELAVATYENALNLCKGYSELKVEHGTILKNKAACQLKLGNYNEALKDCEEALQYLPKDSKALFRKCQALEKLDRLEEAFKIARTLIQIAPKDATVQEFLHNVSQQIQQKTDKQGTTDGMVDVMFTAVFDEHESNERKVQAMKNLIILTNKDSGADIICNAGGVEKLSKIITVGNEELCHLAIKVFAVLCKGSAARAAKVFESLQSHLSICIKSKSPELCNSALSLVSQFIQATVRQPTTKEKQKDEQPPLVYKEQLKFACSVLLDYLLDIEVNARNRSSIIECIITALPGNKNMALLFIEMKGVQKLLQVSAESSCFWLKIQTSSISIEKTVRMHVSVALSKIYDSLGCKDEDKEKFFQDCDIFVCKYIQSSERSLQIKGLAALCTILQGPQDAVTSILNKTEITEVVFTIAQSEEVHDQIAAAEVIALAASNKQRCSEIHNKGMSVLKSLYKSTNEELQVRALVGMCKVGSTGAGDINAKVYKKETILKLYKSTRSFLVRSQEEIEIRKWASEALSFITLDADVKEELIEDITALRSLLDLAKLNDSSLLYGVCQTLVNLTNSYDKPVQNENTEKMKELGKFAKVNIPEFDEKDNEEHVERRISILVKEGVINALVNLAKPESKQCREMIARVFHGIATVQEYRGLIVQQGGARALLPLTTVNTERGKDIASHALAKVAITMNPEFAFPGQKSFELVRPFLSLLHPDKKGLEQFESLMALTNLAGMNNDVRKHIYRERGIPDIESLLFEDHEMIRRAAAECMCNLVYCDEVAELFLQENTTERVKLFTLFSGEEDELLARACSGALAILTDNPKICKKVSEVRPWLEIFQSLLLSPNKELQHRGSYIVRNMMNSSKEIAEKLVESKIFEILLALSQDTKIDVPVKEAVTESLKKAKDWKLIIDAPKE
ncbi:protein unc-45 homolog A-like isoform X2 [Xenia sp. Carnegie-2017]|uniref:protein unc-45 homolog A-like isoform X2 n=1 Tax=Xenia sp. Carnegie-2017 TaxID=2897299 RepID=UPI001F03A279|nr:protein unc-45 homolog A-like isoform X2 [Xenia sp. Carnegie-2017]